MALPSRSRLRSVRARLDGLLRRISGASSNDARFGSGALPDLESSQWWSAQEIAEYQAERLRWMVAWAWEESPFYRDLMRRHRVRPSTVQGPDDLPALPIVTRAVLQGSFDRIIVEPQVHENALSGGTTGHRLLWARSRPWLELFTACLWRGFGWAGLSPEMRLATFYSRVMGKVSENSLIIPGTFDVTRVESDLGRLETFAPEAIYVHASAAHVMARYLLRKGRRLPVRTFITSCDMLFPQYRPVIEEAFDAPLFDNYGCNDGGAWGAECPQHRGFHQDVERAIVEFVDRRMVSTDLWNTAFPFIRYENGDAGAWRTDDCSCGRHAPRFSLHGRRSDLLVTRTRVVFPSNLNRVFLHEGINDARVIQRSATDLHVLLVKNQAFSDADEDRLRVALTELFDGMRVTIEETAAIPETLTGKHRVGINMTDLRPEDVWEARAEHNVP